MKYITADFGSTYTKLTAIDTDTCSIVGTSSAFTTIDTNVMDGFNCAYDKLTKSIGEFVYDELLCCSSAAGGLKMVALGLVPELTAKAARMAASSAGAKVVKTYSYEISKAEKDEIYKIDPDLVLLCGGTDGGNKDVIISNARHLCDIKRNFSIITAGNKVASYELEEILKSAGKDFVITENVMPTFNKLNVEPAKNSIKDLFIRKIIDAKGLSEVQTMTSTDIIPTPLAVMKGCELLSKGTIRSKGIGELLAIDLGGATTDVYSIAKGDPSAENILQKGLPEPYSKRSVEGDLGMRYSLGAMVDDLDIERLAMDMGIHESKITAWVQKCIADPSVLASADTEELQIETALAQHAISVAVERHCGMLESAYTTNGEVFILNGKDLSDVPYVVGTGGAILKSDEPAKLLDGAKFSRKKSNYMKPKNPKFLLDAKYIFSSMGLLSMVDPETSLKIMIREMNLI